MDLSVGYYDYSCTNLLGNSPKVVDHETLLTLLEQLKNTVDPDLQNQINALPFELEDYGHQYMLGFVFAVQKNYTGIHPITGNETYKTQVNSAKALPRKMVETALPSDRDYGFKSNVNYPVMSNRIIELKCFPVTHTPVTETSADRHIELTKERLSVKRRLGYQNPITGKMTRSLIDPNTHPSKLDHRTFVTFPIPRTSTPLERSNDIDRLEREGFYLTQLKPVNYFLSDSGAKVSNKSILAFDENKFKNTKVKMSSGGGSKNPTNLDVYYAYASKYYSVQPNSKQKVRFLLANHHTVYAQLDNKTPFKMGIFTLDHNGDMFLQQQIKFNKGNDLLYKLWQHCLIWADRDYVRNEIIATDKGTVLSDKQKAQKRIRKDHHLNNRLERLRAKKLSAK